MKAILLAASLGAAIIGFTQSTNPILTADFASIGISAIPGNSIPEMAWYVISGVLFGTYMFSLGGHQ